MDPSETGARHPYSHLEQELSLKLIYARGCRDFGEHDQAIAVAQELAQHERPEFQMEGLYLLAQIEWDKDGDAEQIEEWLEEARRLAIDLEDFAFAAEVEELHATVLEGGLGEAARAAKSRGLAKEYQEEAGSHRNRRFAPPTPGYG